MLDLCCTERIRIHNVTSRKAQEHFCLSDVIKLLISISCEIICVKTYTNLWWHTFYVKETQKQCNLMWSLEVSLTKETEALFTYSFAQKSLWFLMQNTENKCNVSVHLWIVSSENYNTNITDGEYWQCSLVSKLHGCSKLCNTVQPCKIQLNYITHCMSSLLLDPINGCLRSCNVPARKYHSATMQCQRPCRLKTCTDA